jgi:hypothetical protein
MHIQVEERTQGREMQELLRLPDTDVLCSSTLTEVLGKCFAQTGRKQTCTGKDHHTVICCMTGRMKEGGSQRRVKKRRKTHLAHDVRQDSPGGANESAHGCQQIVVEQEAFCTQRVPAVTVQQRDDDRHVGTCTRHMAQYDVCHCLACENSRQVNVINCSFITPPGARATQRSGVLRTSSTNGLDAVRTNVK